MDIVEMLRSFVPPYGWPKEWVTAVEKPLNEAAAEITRLRAMVRDAYNDGFSKGMREHTTRRGGVPWSDFKYRAMIAAKDA